MLRTPAARTRAHVPRGGPPVLPGCFSPYLFRGRSGRFPPPAPLPLRSPLHLFQCPSSLLLRELLLLVVDEARLSATVHKSQHSSQSPLPPAPRRSSSSLISTLSSIFPFRQTIFKHLYNMAPQQLPPTGTKALQQCQVAPAPGSVAPATLPLTFFDYLFLPFHPVQRVFFYDLPCSRSRFLENHLPHLKHSLSLALRDFRPLAGKLVLCPRGAKADLRSADGDLVALTVAESGDDFYDLSGNHMREAARLHPLVPSLPLPAAGTGWPVLALQVTLFPDAGVALGVTVQHAVSDGSSSAHFLKTWASLCRLGRKGLVVGGVGSPPSYDRSLVRHFRGLERTFLDDLQTLKGDRRMEAWDLSGRPDLVRATFVVTREQIHRLGQRVYSKTSWEYCSPYSLASGFIWVCLVKARGDTGGKTVYFGFVTGCRVRMDPPAPATYFGNCLGICRVEAGRNDLVGEDGDVVASSAIWTVIKALEVSGAAFRGAENWIRDIFWLASMGIQTVAGSPKLGMYQVDFGWGKPRKVEVVSIETTGAMSIAEWGEEEGAGGLEFGLVLPRDEMKRFGGLFADGLKQLSSS